jgi:hypothetical protein
MRTIWKFPLTVVGEPIEIRLPLGARVLACQAQRDVPTLWVEVDTDAEKITRRFTLIGTGWDMPRGAGHYIGTVQIAAFVWHVYELLS